jgi:hypothetical protein
MARFQDAAENNSFEGKGIRTLTPAYAAAIAIEPGKAFRHYVKPATLTGALTVNATDVTGYEFGDEFVFMFAADGTQRVVTWGTNFLASGTVTIPANKTATATGWFDGEKIRINCREISA